MANVEEITRELQPDVQRVYYLALHAAYPVVEKNLYIRALHAFGLPFEKAERCWSFLTTASTPATSSVNSEVLKPELSNTKFDEFQCASTRQSHCQS